MKEILTLASALLFAGCAGTHPSLDNYSIYGSGARIETRVNLSSGRVYELQNKCANTSCHPMLKLDSNNYTVHPQPAGDCIATFKEQQAIKIKDAPKAVNPYACNRNK